MVIQTFGILQQQQLKVVQVLVTKQHIITTQQLLVTVVTIGIQIQI